MKPNFFITCNKIKIKKSLFQRIKRFHTDYFTCLKVLPFDLKFLTSKLDGFCLKTMIFIKHNVSLFIVYATQFALLSNKIFGVIISRGIPQRGHEISHHKKNQKKNRNISLLSYEIRLLIHFKFLLFCFFFIFFMIHFLTFNDLKRVRYNRHF